MVWSSDRAAFAKWPTTAWRTSSVCARGARSSAKSSSGISLLIALVVARRRRRLWQHCHLAWWGAFYERSAWPGEALGLGIFLVILRLEVLEIRFPDWQSLLFLSGLQLFFKFNFPHQQSIGVSFFSCAPLFFTAGLTLSQTLVWTSLWSACCSLQ